MNREEWLTQVAEKYIKPAFRDLDAAWPEAYRVSIGFPKGRGRGANAIGQCWSPTASADKTPELFVSPELDPARAVDVLIHELVHASVGLKEGHKGAFRKLAQALGLEGKMTATVAGAALLKTITGWLEKMPAFPGAVLSLANGDGAKKEKGPGSRLVKCQCPDCEYTIRTTAKWIEVGLPVCPCGTELEVRT